MALNGVGAGVGSAAYTSLSGLRDATLRLNVAANNIANANTDDFVPDRVESQALASGGVSSSVESTVAYAPPTPGSGSPAPSLTDIATESVNLVVAKRAFEANAKALKAQDEAEKSLIDLVA